MLSGQLFNNRHIERFQGFLRRDCLNSEVFIGIVEARDKIGRWIENYNTQELYSGPGYCEIFS